MAHTRQESYELPGEPDSGLAEERTELAWNRSGLAVVVVVAIMLRRLWPLDDEATFAVLIVLASGSLAWAVGMVLARRGGQERTGSGVMGITACRYLTAGTLALAAAGVLLAFLAPA